jgi:hypothetical protein
LPFVPSLGFCLWSGFYELILNVLTVDTLEHPRVPVPTRTERHTITTTRSCS